MSAPSDLHEERVRVLDTMASLAGLALPARIGDRRIPDVVRTTVERNCVLIGDAKASESPTCPETLSRLAQYVRAVRRLLQTGVPVRLAVCHGELHRVEAWERSLQSTVQVAGASVVARPASWKVDDATVVTWVDLAGPDRVPGRRRAPGAESQPR